MQETITAVISTEEKEELKALNHPVVQKILEQDEWRKAIANYADQIEIAELFVAHNDKHGDDITMDDWETELSDLVAKLDKTAICKKTYETIMGIADIVLYRGAEMALKVFDTQKALYLYDDDSMGKVSVKIKSVADGEVSFAFTHTLHQTQTLMEDEFWDEMLRHKRGTTEAISDSELEEL
jgi:hypothetical protein